MSLLFRGAALAARLSFLCIVTQSLFWCSGARAAPYSVQQRLEQFGKRARERWGPYFKRRGLAYPPKRITLLGLKKEARLEVYMSGDGPLHLVRRIPVCAASGNAGPKLRQGDYQVPEGIYRISFLNANSRFHLSLRVNYPNAFDRAKAKQDGRSNLGGDIMIHGNCVSIGCLAIRDEAAEDLFVLAADAGMRNIKVVLAPFDMRERPVREEDFAEQPSWLPELYRNIKAEFDKLVVQR